LAILVSWLIWKERNSWVFNRRVGTVADVLARIVDEVLSWSQAGYKCLEPALAGLSRLLGRAVITM